MPSIHRRSKPTAPRVATLLVLIVLTCWLVAPGNAEIYKYKKDGVWTYTDTPPANLPEDSQVLPESGRTSERSVGQGQILLSHYPARTPIEKATAGTVAVQSSLGFGSGFFISADGYLITNKHVIRTIEVQTNRSKDRFSQAESKIDQLEKQFDRQAQKLKNYKARIDNLKRYADAESHPQRKQAYLEDYRENLKTYHKSIADHEKHWRVFKAQKRRFQSDRQHQNYSNIVADLSQSFTIFLADNSQHYVRLVAVSSRYDLALLKLDGYQVPLLRPAGTTHMIQGDPLYAIGSPVKLKNSVTSGVFSGFEKGFIQTDTRIYPGNSGGPLVNAEGRVVGINTFKQLTHKFEGLGFAIPIRVALQEFAPYLPTP